MKGPKLAAVAWRNLWRQKRRTLLTLSSIAFGGFLAVLFTALQDRSFADFIDTAARLGGGHVTLQHSEYLNTPTLTRTVQDAGRLRDLVSQDQDVEQVVNRITGQIMLATASDSFGLFSLPMTRSWRRITPYPSERVWSREKCTRPRRIGALFWARS